MAIVNTLISEEYMIDGKLYEISKAIVPHKYVDRLALTEYIITESDDPSRYCLKNEIKIEDIAGKKLWCSKIYVDKDNNITSINCCTYNEEFFLLLKQFEELIKEGYFTQKGIDTLEEIKGNIKRLGNK